MIQMRWLILLAFAQVVYAESSTFKTPQWENVRFHLQNLLNEEDLIIKNKRAAAADLKKLDRNMEELQIYRRIPLKRDLSQLEKEIRQLAKENRLKWIDFKLNQLTGMTKKVRSQIWSDFGQYPVSEDQLTEKQIFTIRVSGSAEAVARWEQAISQAAIRLIQIDSKKAGSDITHSKITWIIQGHSYSFRNIKYPTILPKDPLSFIPLEYRKKLSDFSAEEPKLWKMIHQIKELRPATLPLYQLRSEVLLKDAQFNFYLAQSQSGSTQGVR